MVQKIVREKVEEHKQKELVKHRELAASERALNKMSKESASPSERAKRPFLGDHGILVCSHHFVYCW